MNKQQIQVFTGNLVNPGSAQHRMVISVQNGKIAGVIPMAERDPGPNDIDAREYMVIPGLIDIHNHGTMNESFMSDCTARARSFLASKGTTAILAPTFPYGQCGDRHGLLLGGDRPARCGFGFSLCFEDRGYRPRVLLRDGHARRL